MTAGPVAVIRKEKLQQLRSVLRKDLTHQWDGDVVNFLTDEVRAAARIVETENVSGHPYPRNNFLSGLKVRDEGARTC